MLSNQQIDFIISHESEDISSLLFKKDKYPDLEIEKLITIIESRKKVKRKIPSWYNCISLEYSNSLAIEQCSSEETALYKQRFVKNKTVIDLTGGLGVDSYFISKVAKHVTYIERQEALSSSVRDNFVQLGANNITVINGDSLSLLASLSPVDVIYLDPARRDTSAKRVYSIEDSEPNLIEIKDTLFQLADTILVKLSPMFDISRTIELLENVSEVHILASENECKELLVLLEKNRKVGNTVIFVDGISFTLEEEKKSSVQYAEELKKYLYVPSKAMMKAGAFKLITRKFNLSKLSISTHLYTSDSLLDSFPGRVFEIIEVCPFGNKIIKYLSSKYTKANIIALNLPIDTNALRTKLRIPDGGDIYLFGCKKGDEKVIIAAKQIFS